MNKDEWVTEFEIAIIDSFGIIVADTGFTYDEFWDRFAEEGEVDPVDAALWYGEKYGLSRVDVS